MLTLIIGNCEEMVSGLLMGARSLRELDWEKAERWGRLSQVIGTRR